MNNLHAKRNGRSVHCRLMQRAFGGFLFVTFLLIATGIAGAETFVKGIIGTDTLWSAGGSPYVLTGDVTISARSSLIIDSGVTVNMNGYTMHIQGKFHAWGTAFHLSAGEREGTRSTIIIKSGGSADFEHISADGTDYIVVEAGATVNVSAPAQEPGQ